MIIGCGNADRGDDGAGLLVARKLKQRGIDALELSGEGLGLLESWTGAGRVIIVDAVITGAAVGTISIWDARNAPVVRDAFRASTHAFGVAEAVELGRVLGRMPESLIIYGIEGERFDLGAETSPEVAAAIDRVVGKILEGIGPAGTL